MGSIIINVIVNINITTINDDNITINDHIYNYLHVYNKSTSILLLSLFTIMYIFEHLKIFV